jgi:hypothetical protein
LKPIIHAFHASKGNQKEEDTKIDHRFALIHIKYDLFTSNIKQIYLNWLPKLPLETSKAQFNENKFSAHDNKVKEASCRERKKGEGKETQKMAK